MPSYATHRLRARDPARSPGQRFAALRTCLAEFAPYGFHATYHHLTRSAGIPPEPEEDPEAVVRAVDELDAARELWRDEFAAWKHRRRAQKAAGVRVPDPPEPVRRLWYPDPERHPGEPLPDVMPRILCALAGGADHCPVCGPGPTTRAWHDGHAAHRLCAGCGTSLAHRLTDPDPEALALRAERWRMVWRRMV
ncbi:hypothetical protein AB0P15_33155 [Streptomyces sp. NPDC087917]|uniref:hypothetical protein n=1 Tax=Streptomyces sp. NPDC087917 TaxID=3155060 RepID=UPI00343E385C